MARKEVSQVNCEEMVEEIKHLLIFCQELGESNEKTLQSILNVYKRHGIWIEGGYNL